MNNFLRRVILLVIYPCKVHRIQRNAMKKYDLELDFARNRLLHDPTVSIDDLGYLLLEEAERLQKLIKAEVEQKIADLIKM